MSAGSVSLESAIRTCKVDTAYAAKIESDRFLNPGNMVCPVWNGVDSSGRQVCPDSFYTKRAGCNSATDRVSVENDVSRPQYMEYITLSASGIKGNMYGTMPQANSAMRSEDLRGINDVTGNFGLQFGSKVIAGCGVDAYKRGMAQVAQSQRQEQAQDAGYEAYMRRRSSGM